MGRFQGRSRLWLILQRLFETVSVEALRMSDVLGSNFAPGAEHVER